MKKNSETTQDLIKGKLLAKNTLWNVFGQGLPLLVGLACIPILVDKLGVDGFGVLALSWMVIGYFSIFDFGLGRALTKLIAEKLGLGSHDDISELIWTALVIMAVLGVIGGLVIFSITPWLIFSFLKIPEQLKSDTVTSFYLLALSIPIVIGTVGLRGVLEAYQRFDLANYIRIPLGAWTFVGPVLILQFTEGLMPVVLMLVIGRFIALLAHIVFCIRVVPQLTQSLKLNNKMVKPLISFGGWMTISNIVGPIMVYMDRLLIGAVISISAVAYYTTPYEVVTKLWMIPMSLTAVLFPAFTTSHSFEKSKTVDLYERGLRYIFIVMLPIIFTVVLFSYEGLNLWLGEDFATNGFVVLQLLAVGVFINSTARIPFALIQGLGRPDLVAKVHLIELPLYLLALWWALQAQSLMLVALVWVLRIVIDTGFMLRISSVLLPETRAAIGNYLGYMSLSMFALLISTLDVEFYSKLLLLIIFLFMFIFLSWKFLLDSNEREAIGGIFNRFGISGSGSK